MAHVASLPFNESTKDIVFERNEDHSLATNIAQQWTWHSPDGFNAGYAGSGPADFALNILRVHKLPFVVAVFLHQTFKVDFLSAPLFSIIGQRHTIKGRDIRDWITAKLATARGVHFLVEQLQDVEMCLYDDEKDQPSYFTELFEYHPELKP